MKNIWLEGIMGVVVGDALGLPAQFLERDDLRSRPVKGMEGFGVFAMPAGTWSDDSSMTLATLISIQKKGGIDYQDMMNRFVRWHSHGEYTPEGITFDQGNTCVEAIERYMLTKDYITCGKTGERANGNGALMRIMPVCLYAYEKVKKGEWDTDKAIEVIHQVTALTHNHMRAKVASGIYYFMVKAILDESGSLRKRLQRGVDEAMDFYHGDVANPVQLAHYERLVDLHCFEKEPDEAIKSSGYVVDTLECVVWSLITTSSFEEALLKVVNLGGDADTAGAIAGGLAALYYGYESIPSEWSQVIKRREWIEGILLS